MREQTTVICLTIIACYTIHQLGVEGAETSLSIASGLIGYLARGIVHGEK